MIKEVADKFTHEWITAWNKHDLDMILSHYADEISFYSPFVSLLAFNGTGIINNKSDLEAYFERGLNAFPDLYFDLHHYFTGVDSLAIYYTSVNGRQAVEVFELNKAGQAINVRCHYSHI